MRRVLTVVFVTLLLSPAGAGEERGAGDAALTPEEAADAVVCAFAASNAAALVDLAARDEPDPWLVADELLRRGEAEAALVFAGVAPRHDVAALPVYVERRRGEDEEADARAALQRVQDALDRGGYAAARSMAQAVESAETLVLGIRLRYAAGLASRGLRRWRESYESLAAAARGATAIGWWRRAAHAWEESGISATRGSYFTAGREAFERQLPIEERRGNRRGVAFALANLGKTYFRVGANGEASTYLTRALAIREALGDRRGVADVHGALGVVHHALGDLSQAIAHQKRALALTAELGHGAGEAAALTNLGGLHRDAREFEKALACQVRALALYEGLGDRRGMAATLQNLGVTHGARGDHAKARAYDERALTLMEEVGDRSGRAAALGSLASSCCHLGAYAEALSYAEQALALQDALGDGVEVAGTLRIIGAVHERRGDYAKALSCLDRAIALSERHEDRAGLSVALGNAGNVLWRAGEYTRALSLQERSLALKEATGDRAGVATTLANMGAIHRSVGDYPRALAHTERALTIMKELGDGVGVASTLQNLGLSHWSLGAHAMACSYLERSLAMMEALGDRHGTARTLANLGSLYRYLGEYEKAGAYLERAMVRSEELGERAGVGTALAYLGELHLARGDLPQAHTYLGRALAIGEEVGELDAIASALSVLGAVHGRRGDHARAKACMERALALREETGDRDGVASCLGDLGVWHARRGDYEVAVRYLDRAVRSARRLRARATFVHHAGDLAVVHLRSGRPERALVAAQQGLTELEGLLGGLAEEEGARLREKHARLFGAGALAAARLREPAGVATFIESGRAGSLLETLGGRQALRWTSLPEELRRAEAEARAEENLARREYEQVLAAGDGRPSERKRKALDYAHDRVREVAARIQREAKRQAGLFYPRAATLEEVRERLEEGQALVLYGLCLEEALALVVTSDAGRIVSVGDTAEVEAACREAQPQILSSVPRGPLSDGDSAAEAPPADVVLRRLRAVLVDPLDLPDGVTTVLVSPEGPLCYVPFGALFGERNVALTPSGTTHVLLREEEREPGHGVLALGDPEYGGRVDPGAAALFRHGEELTPLPATRDEALAVGDVILLGEQASEPALREALSQRDRWRAVHLACHGLVDPERPTCSSLALTRAGDDDGFLTALEVLRMEIPADLVVLSACETATGRVVQGEGIVGLTRAFMYAGTPRVLCSLWKVDDDATRALMTKFYEEWNPDEGEGLPAAEALRNAQAFVRGHGKWAHPYYWAAWVLWGLP